MSRDHSSRESNNIISCDIFCSPRVKAIGYSDSDSKQSQTRNKAQGKLSIQFRVIIRIRYSLRSEITCTLSQYTCLQLTFITGSKLRQNGGCKTSDFDPHSYVSGKMERMFGGSKYINKDFLIKEFQDCSIPQMQRACTVSANVTFELPKEFRPKKLSKKVKVALTPANQLSISQLLKLADNGPVRGKFFLCRTLLIPFKMVSMVTIVDDPEGVHALRLALYNYNQTTIPVGTILAIKNPWLKPSMDGGIGIRVENHEDVITLDSKSLKELNLDVTWHGEIPPVKDPYEIMDYKKKGNAFFVEKNYLGAVQMYSLGLITEKVPLTRLEFYSNRAMAYLNMNEYKKALEDADSALQLNPRFLKAHYRKIKALFGLKKFADALDFVTDVTIPTFKNMPMSAADQKTLDELEMEAKLNLEISHEVD